MKIFKWCIVLLCLTMLSACSQQEVIHGPIRSPNEKTPQQIQAEFTVLLDGEEAEFDGVYVGTRPAVSLQQAEAVFAMELQSNVGIYLHGQAFILLEEACRQAGAMLVQDTEKDTMYISSHAGLWQIPEGYSVPTLMYHGVSNDMWGMTELFVMPERMEEQFRYLVENGYTPIFFEDLQRVDEIEKPVLLTYDDGYVDNYVDLFPLVKKYGVKVNIFVVTGTVDNSPNSLTSEQIREMHASGLVSFQSHTVTHPYLMGMSRQEQEYELTRSALELARLTDQLPTVICYPSGSYDETTLELARQYYKMGVDMNGNEYITGEDPYQVQRYYMRRQDTLATFIQYIQP